MRIVVVNNFFPPRVGGSSHLSESLARAYVEAGHAVLVVTSEYEGAPEHERMHGFDVVRLPAWRMPRLGTAVDFDIAFSFGPRNLRRVFRLLDDFGPDVLHQHGQFLDLTWLTSIYARRRRLPVLLSVHTRLESPGAVYGALFRALDAIAVRPFLALSRPRFVVMDRLMDEYLRDRYGATDATMTPIPVGVDELPEVEHDARARIRAQLGIDNRPMVLSIGHVIPLRDRVGLVEALPAIVERIPDVVVVVVGDVNYDAFLSRAVELGVRDHIVCTGAVPRRSVWEHLAAADVETHDLQGLGLGTASLEAMLACVPVVAAVRPDNFPGIELRSDENIVLVPVGDSAALADAICRVLEHPHDARRVACAQRALVEEHFSMRAVSAAYLDELAQLAGSGAR